MEVSSLNLCTPCSLFVEKAKRQILPIEDTVYIAKLCGPCQGIVKAAREVSNGK